MYHRMNTDEMKSKYGPILKSFLAKRVPMPVVLVLLVSVLILARCA